MLSLAYACGLRVSELTGLQCTDHDRRDPASLRVTGNGRRERILPLWKETRAALDAWLRLRDPDGDTALFHNRSRRAMLRSGFEHILERHVVTAAKVEPGLADKRVTPHVLRHGCAMHTLPDRPVERSHMIMLSGSMQSYVWTINGAARGQHQPIAARGGERVSLTFHNMSMMGHPMHLHGHVFQIVGLNGRRFAGALRDTVYVPPMSMVAHARGACRPWLRRADRDRRKGDNEKEAGCRDAGLRQARPC